jgi:hypothetical protein
MKQYEFTDETRSLAIMCKNLLHLYKDYLYESEDYKKLLQRPLELENRIFYFKDKTERYKMRFRPVNEVRYTFAAMMDVITSFTFLEYRIKKADAANEGFCDALPDIERAILYTKIIDDKLTRLENLYLSGEKGNRL